MFNLIIEFFTNHTRDTWQGSEVIASLTAFSREGLILARKFKSDSIYYKKEILEVIDEGFNISTNLNQSFCDNFDYIADYFRNHTNSRWYTREILDHLIKFETYTKSAADVIYFHFENKKPGALFYKYEIVDAINALRDEFWKVPHIDDVRPYPENVPVVTRKYPYIGKHNSHNLYILFSKESTGTVLSSSFDPGNEDLVKKYTVGYHAEDFVEWLFDEYVGWINLNIANQFVTARIQQVSTYETDGRWDFH